MSANFSFLFDDNADEVSKAADALSKFDRSDFKKPPAGWNA
eukprot:CAMPEP_0179134604 /NCGR_PEP_ID=MMETSP0796-20121207/64058_1 /TAXON_ID=73915 /ORGANISM="Pyrodinium bahamense, Strain pbaha01" /LENGTH=40 /DNA_ID= /DNA_START= /DNA_END= /DNA_ORIENTATION=